LLYTDTAAKAFRFQALLSIVLLIRLMECLIDARYPVEWSYDSGSVQISSLLGCEASSTVFCSNWRLKPMHLFHVDGQAWSW